MGRYQNTSKRSLSDRHAGLDPASRRGALRKNAGFRIKSGMTKQSMRLFAILTLLLQRD